MVERTVLDPWGDDRHSTARSQMATGGRGVGAGAHAERSAGPSLKGRSTHLHPGARARGRRPLVQPARQRRRRGSAAASRGNRNDGVAVWTCSARSVASAARGRTGQLSRRSVMSVD
jgi:hypothetical protein